MNFWWKNIRSETDLKIKSIKSHNRKSIVSNMTRTGASHRNWPLTKAWEHVIWKRTNQRLAMLPPSLAMESWSLCNCTVSLHCNYVEYTNILIGESITESKKMATEGGGKIKEKRSHPSVKPYGRRQVRFGTREGGHISRWMNWVVIVTLLITRHSSYSCFGLMFCIFFEAWESLCPL